MKHKFFHSLIVAALACLIPLEASASKTWNLDAQQSSLTYLSSKMIGETFNTTIEPNRFKVLAGTISAKGQVKITVDMNSVDTGIEIRDQRVRQYAFATERYPQASITLSLPDLATDKGQAHSVKAAVTIRGIRKELKASVYVRHYFTTAGKEILIAQSASPVLLDAAAYNMLDGFEKLRDLAKLFNITTTIPVSFHLLFTKQAE